MNDFSVSIVIPTYNTWELTNKLLFGLIEHEHDNITEVIVVDDGSERANRSTEPWEERLLPYLRKTTRIEALEKNSGFTLACNHGLKLATRPLASKHLVFLISNDVQIKGKFIEQAADILFSARRHLVGNRHITFDSGWNTFQNKTFDYLEGWFLAATSDGWRDLNFFDPAYAPFDMEDIDLSTTAKTKGYKLVSLNNPNIVHQGGGTLGFNPEREKITLRNKEYFRTKWTK